jgi:hypothetical protein
MGSAARRRGVLGSIPEEEDRREDAVSIWEAAEVVRGTRWFSEVQMSSQRAPAPPVAFALALPAPVDRIRRFMPERERRVQVLPRFDPSGSIPALIPLEMAGAATLATISQADAEAEEVARRGSLLDLGEAVEAREPPPIRNRDGSVNSEAQTKWVGGGGEQRCGGVRSSPENHFRGDSEVNDRFAFAEAVLGGGRKRGMVESAAGSSFDQWSGGQRSCGVGSTDG